MNATKLSYLLHVWARFANRSSITMVSSSRMIFRPVFRWEINGRQYLNNHYKTNNSDDKSNYSKLHDRECHVTSDYSYLFSSRLPPSGWKKRLGRWTISLATEFSAWRVTKRNLWRSVTSNRIDQNIFNYDQNEAKSKINKQWSWNNSRWQAWRKTAICEYPNSAGFYFRVRENQGQLYASDAGLFVCRNQSGSQRLRSWMVLNVSTFQTTRVQKKCGRNRNVNSTRVFTTALLRGITT